MVKSAPTTGQIATGDESVENVRTIKLLGSCSHNIILSTSSHLNQPNDIQLSYYKHRHLKTNLAMSR